MNSRVAGSKAMTTICRTSWLLLACICMTSHLSAQSQQPGYLVTLRELSVPPKALRDFAKGTELLAKNNPEASLLLFQRAISEYAGYYEAYDRIGAANLKLWRVPEAERAFRKSIEVSGGQYAHPFIALGAILDDRKIFVEAESVIRKGLNLDRDSWRGHYYLALAQFGLSRLADAEQSVQEALRRKPDFPEAQLLLANIRSHEEDYRSLVSDLNE
jgi:tetratricopeptide (TPR) repeat protein